MKLLFENWQGFLNESYEQMPDQLAQFIVNSNAIEGYDVDLDNALFVITSQGAEEGSYEHYQLKLANSPYIRSHLDGLAESKEFSGGVPNVKQIKNVHKAMGADVLDDALPGYLRSGGLLGGDVEAKGGPTYVSGPDVAEALIWWTGREWQDPFKAHTAYELIHPFGDGNGRSGRIILAAMTNYDLRSVNSFIENKSSYLTEHERIGKEFQGKFWKENNNLQ